MNHPLTTEDKRRMDNASVTDTIKPEVGKRYVMRNGGVTGVMRKTDLAAYPFADGSCSWADAGTVWFSGREDERDLISEYIEPAPAPAVDLTANEKPFGLLDAETQKAMQDWPHGWQVFCGSEWRDVRNPQFDPHLAYRAKPAPAPVERKPREWWIVAPFGYVPYATTDEAMAKEHAAKIGAASVIRTRVVIE